MRERTKRVLRELAVRIDDRDAFPVLDPASPVIDQRRLTGTGLTII